MMVYIFINTYKGNFLDLIYRVPHHDPHCYTTAENWLSIRSLLNVNNVTILALKALILLMLTAQLCISAMSKNSFLSDHNGGVHYIQ